MPLTSSQLTQKAAGYMLAAANANSRENKAKKNSSLFKLQVNLNKKNFFVSKINNIRKVIKTKILIWFMEIK